MKIRQVEPEVMDQPDIDPALHRTALQALARINVLSGTARVLWRSVREAARHGPCRVLDMASGGGDVACDLARRAERAGLPVEVRGCDISPRAVETATERARRMGLRSVQFFAHDLLRDGVPEDFDVITCTLFLHHLTRDDAVALLRGSARAARQLVLIDDLRRTRFGYFLAVMASRVLTLSPVVRVDGPLSVRAAFTVGELREMADAAGMPAVSIQRHWPQRMLLTCRTAGGVGSQETRSNGS